jgi:hypothetical protein
LINGPHRKRQNYGGYSDAWTEREQGDLISLILFFFKYGKQAKKDLKDTGCENVVWV